MDFLSGGDADTGASQAQTQQGIDSIRELLGQTRGDIDPFIQAGQGAISGLQELFTPGRLDSDLGQIFGLDAFQNLRDERTRAAQGQLAAGGLTRSGRALTDISNIPTELGFNIENLLTGRNLQNLNTLFQGGRQSATDLGGFTTAAGGQIGQLRGGQAGFENQAQIAAQQRQASLFNELIGGGAKIASAAFGGGGGGSFTDFFSGGGGDFADLGFDPTQGFGFAEGGGFGTFDFTSDERFKDNVEKIGEIGSLNLYQWDWSELTKRLLDKIPALRRLFMTDKDGPPIGFMAHEVKEKFPQYVSERLGFMTINLQGLLEELEAV